jgi:small conductance mechanosensitive channel
VGDYIKAQSQEGFVKEIQLLVTILETNDKATIYIPNGELANNNMINYSHFGTLRLQLPINLALGVDFEKARQILLQVMDKNSLVYKDPPPQVVVIRISSGEVNLVMRPWILPATSSTVTTDLYEAAYIALTEAGIDFADSSKMLLIDKNII